jgi:hypothetical protein
MIISLMFFILLIFAASTFVAKVFYPAIAGEKPKKELGYDPHKTMQLEIAELGQAWWEDFGTKCECAICTENKALNELVTRQAEHAEKKRLKDEERRRAERLGYKDGYNFQYPPDVPLNAHVEIEKEKSGWRYGDVAPIHFTWTDTETGRPMGLRTTATRDQFHHVFVDEFEKPVKTIVEAPILTPNEARELKSKKFWAKTNSSTHRVVGFIDYEAAIDNYHQAKPGKRPTPPPKVKSLPNPVDTGSR